MKELEDKDFDQIFKNRIKEGHLEYEEESWLKMEKKLLKRDRFVFYRNASILLVFLSIGIGIYLMSDKKAPTTEVKFVKKTEKQVEREVQKTVNPQDNSEYLTNDATKIVTTSPIHKKRNSISLKNRALSITDQSISTYNSSPTTQSPIVDQDVQSNPALEPKKQEPSKIINSSSLVKTDIDTTNGFIIDKKNTLANEIKSLPRKPKPISLSINVGPDFNSTENAIGGKSGMAVGLGVSVPLSRKLSVQTGINYGSKNYEAKGYDYTFKNPNTMYIISGIDASCKVLEIPLRASYAIEINHKNSVDLNAGLSSYIMLKENYRFMYTAASGRKDRLLEEKNANQHYLSVIDLSATYNIKLKNKKFALGLEPYIKIPLSGIGEGNVPLKSSGISLKLNYELSKKK